MTRIRLALFEGVNARTAWLRIILLGAAFTGMAASVPVWLTARDYPLLPVAPWFPALPFPWDQWFFAVVFLSLVLAGWFYRPAVFFFLCAALFLYLGDQNRAQPWFYLYWVMLLLTLLPEPITLAGCRWAVSAVYVWSGVHVGSDWTVTIPSPSGDRFFRLRK